MYSQRLHKISTTESVVTGIMDTQLKKDLKELARLLSLLLLKIALYVFLTVTILSNIASTQRTELNNRAFVQAICDSWRNNNQLSTVSACGQAQTKTNTEYLCDSTGKYCWVEQK